VLRRQVGLVAVTALVVGEVVGIGIFSTRPAWLLARLSLLAVIAGC